MCSATPHWNGSASNAGEAALTASASRFEIRLAEDDADIRLAYPVMLQLRPQYEPDAFAEQVRRQQADGYRLAVLVDEETAAAVAGYRLGENLAWGRYLYVDDLVTDSCRTVRAGHGRDTDEMATGTGGRKRTGCDELHLDSGVQRFAAHRFYLRHRMDITSHHFTLRLRGRSESP